MIIPALFLLRVLIIFCQFCEHNKDSLKGFTITLLCTELTKRTDILPSPAPSVNVQDFQTNAVIIKILWWIPDLTKAGGVRSAVMQDVYETLNREGISFEK